MIANIINQTLYAYGITPSDLFIPTRGKKHISDARLTIMHLLFFVAKKQQWQIKLIIDRHHTSVMYGIGQVECWLQWKSEFSDKYEQIKNSLNKCQ